MARVILAWELGGGYGHLARLGALARELRARGHEPWLVLQDLSYVAERLGADGFACLQAPLWVHPRTSRTIDISYADILLGAGFADPVRLSGLVGGWRALFELIDPDLLVSDMAPAAMLAASVDAIPTIMIGCGFFPPRSGSPLPALLPGPGPGSDRAALAAVDARLCASLNAIRVAADLPALDAAQDFFAGPALLCCLAESDPGGPRTGATYVGPMLETGRGIAPAWPLHPGPRLFGYLSGTYSGFDRLIEACQALDASVLLHVRDLDAARAAALERPNLRIELAPVRMEAALAQCDAVLGNATHGTVDAALLAGRPLIVAPATVENALISTALVRHGLAAQIAARQSAVEMRATLAATLADAAIVARATALARRYADMPDPARTAANECEALLARG